MKTGKVYLEYKINLCTYLEKNQSKFVKLTRDMEKIIILFVAFKRIIRKISAVFKTSLNLFAF